MVKRLFDIIFSTISLIVLLPFNLAIMMILLATGEHEVFYRQSRVGRAGKSFKVWKFVTMKKNSSNMGTGFLTIKDDPRILPFGKFLRRTKINEIPQLWNVLKGEMSIIGPRPQAEPHFKLFSIQVQQSLIKLRPGLSGIGSIVFRNEEELLSSGGSESTALYGDAISSYKGDLEAWYVNHNSLAIDILLIFLTLWVVIFPDSRLHWRILPGLPKPSNNALHL